MGHRPHGALGWADHGRPSRPLPTTTMVSAPFLSSVLLSFPSKFPFLFLPFPSLPFPSSPTGPLPQGPGDMYAWPLLEGSGDMYRSRHCRERYMSPGHKGTESRLRRFALRGWVRPSPRKNLRNRGPSGGTSVVAVRYLTFGVLMEKPLFLPENQWRQAVSTP